MADLIRVDYGQMDSLASDVRRLGDALDTIKSRISAVRVEQRSGADVRVSLPSVRFNSIEQAMRSGTTEECLKSLAANVGSLNFYTDRLRRGINEALAAFSDNERMLAGNFNGLKTPDGLMLGVAQAMGYGLEPAGWTPAMREKLQNVLKDAQILTDEDMTFLVSGDQAFLFSPLGLIGAFTTKTGLSGVSATSRIFDGQHRLESEYKLGVMDGGLSYKDSLLKPGDLFRDQGQYDTKTGKSSNKAKDTGKQLGLFAVGASAEESYSAIGENFARKDGKLSTEGSAGIGNLGANASIKGGIGTFVTGDNKGDLIIGGEAQVGVSASAINVDGSMTYELCDYVSVGVGSEVSVLEGEASAGAGVGYVDGKMMAYAEASAEANVAEVEVEGSLDLGLVEGKVGGSVSFGIGAHAKAGYDDGVISYDVGAAFGLGVSVKGEVDISGAIDAVGDGVGHVMKAASEGWNMLQSSFAG